MTCSLRGVSAEGRAGTVREDATNEYTVTYKVTSDDRNDGPGAVESCFGVPSIGDLYQVGNDFDAGARVTGKQVRQISPWEWEVDITYDNQPIDIRVLQAQQDDNPLNQPVEIKYSFQQRTRAVPGTFNDPAVPPSNRTFDGPIYASNGEAFDPQPEMEVTDPVLTIKRNLQTIDGAFLMSLSNSVNSDYWQNAEPRQLKIGGVEASSKYHEKCGYYWEVTYSIAYRWETWDIQLLNQGTYYWTAGVPTSMWGTTIRPSVKQTALGEPRLINLTTAGNINTGSTPTYTRLRVYREVDFSTLGLV
jgi:hypothetical protein